MTRGRERLLELLAAIEDLDDFDFDDAVIVADILLEAYNTEQVMTWLLMTDIPLNGTPLALIIEGSLREVRLRAQQLVLIQSKETA